MKQILFILFFLPSFCFSQKLVKGIIYDSDQDKPLAAASIFLNNTSIGTKSDEKGNFSLRLPSGKFDLIVSCIGYETYTQTINSGDVADFLTIKLRLRAEEMEAIIIEPYEKDGWEKWGHFFNNSFIGTTGEARESDLKNPEVLKFRNSKKNNELTVVAYAPLIIENKALGYRIHYQLESFSYQFNSRYLVYTGYPFFEEMEGNANKKKKWEKRRTEVYFGSVMHFMRSVYRNQIREEGFDVRSVERIPNLEKTRIKAIYAAMKHERTPGGILIINKIEKDSAEYFQKILAQEDYREVIGKDILAGDSIAYAVDSTTAALAFDNYLMVIYKHKLAPVEYRQMFPKSSTAMMSQLLLLNNRPIEIEANGNYYHPIDLLTLGYWSWSEKIATMLPFDYKSPKKLN
jgi:hypothetical protein